MNALNNNIWQKGRVIAWVDYAKGICIILVVMMHTTLEYGQAVSSEGWLHQVVAFTRPFLLPAFFLLSGIFLSWSITSRLRDFIDKKFIHFCYFYLVWLTIQLVITESALVVQQPTQFLTMFFVSWVEPINSLWLVHMLAIFYLATRMLADIPKWLVFLLAAFLQIAFSFRWIDTGWSVPDRFFEHYVYFFAGYAAAAWVFSFARQIPGWKLSVLFLITIWAVVNGMLTVVGSDTTPGIGLLLGFLGAAAIVAAGSLLATQRWAGWLRYCGANSIAIYLSYFLFMSVGLKIMTGSGWIADVGTSSLLITIFSVCTPLVFHWLIKDTGADFLYERPELFRLTGNASRRLKY